MRQPVDTNVLAELEEIEIEFWMSIQAIRHTQKPCKSYPISYPVLRITSRSHLQSIVSRTIVRFRLIVILTLPDPN